MPWIDMRFRLARAREPDPRADDSPASTLIEMPSRSTSSPTAGTCPSHSVTRPPTVVDSVSSSGMKIQQIVADGPHRSCRRPRSCRRAPVAEIALRLMLVVDLADDLLHHVFHGDDARRSTVLVHHHRHVRAFFLHLAQQVVDRLGFGHGADGPHNVADLRGGALVLRVELRTCRARARIR